MTERSRVKGPVSTLPYRGGQALEITGAAFGILREGFTLGFRHRALSNEPKEHSVSSVIPDKYLDLFKKKAFANLATLMPGGQPQVTPVWVDYDGGQVLINTAVGRQKDANLQRDSRVSLSIMDPDNPYRYLEIRGRVSERTTSGADAHIDKMAKKYMDKDTYPFRQPTEVRVIFKITPDHVSSMG
jgi:PPOX class probable F420-dependent enzyme